MILLTGASGFVGRAVFSALKQSRSVRTTLRQFDSRCPGNIDVIQASLSPDQDWSAALSGVTAIVHCAARVHVMNEKSADPLAEFRKVNVDGTLHLARKAAQAGVRRFVFVSSIKVNGEQSLPGRPILVSQAPSPSDPYGVSKSEAEMELRLLSENTGMEVVIVRPPLVYGPEVKANFLAMMGWLTKGMPLPLGRVTENRRSFVFLDNLVDLIVTCVDHPAAANQTFLVSDGEDLSTTDLLRRMASALGRPAYLLPVPPILLRLGASLVGKPEISLRLCGSLQVDISHTMRVLDWRPPFSVDEGLKRTAEAYLTIQRHAS